MKIRPVHISLSVLAAALLLIATGCGQNEETDWHDHSSHAMMEESAESASHNEGHSGEHHEDGSLMEKKPADARAITIIATDFAFEPKTITAAPGEKLYVTLVNKGQAVHMWQLEGLPETHLHTPVGETAAKTIVAPMKVSPYKIICSTPGHEQLGMIGQLEVRSNSDAESGAIHPPMLTPSSDESEHAHTH